MTGQIYRTHVAGATLLVVQEHSLPLVRFAIALRHGASHDPGGRSGASRTMLELMLRGTASRSRRAFDRELEALGSSLYAVTEQDTGMLLGCSLTRHLEETFYLVQEAMHTPAFDASELQQLQEETIDELRAARDDDDTVAEIFLRQALFRGHALGRSAAGEIRDLHQIDTATVSTTYEARIAAGELIVGFAGDITPEDATQLTQRLTQGLPPTIEPLRPLPEPRAPGRARITVVHKPERTQTQLRLGQLAYAGHQAEAMPFWLGAVAFGGTFTSPWTQEIRNRRGWSYDASVRFDRRRIHPAPFVMQTAPSLDDTLDCLALELDLFDNLATRGPAEADIERARAYLLNVHPLRYAQAADLLMPAVKNELIGCPPNLIHREPDDLTATTCAAVALATTARLDPDHLEMVLVASDASLTDALRRRFGDDAVEVLDYQEGLELPAQEKA